MMTQLVANTPDTETHTMSPAFNDRKIRKAIRALQSAAENSGTTIKEIQFLAVFADGSEIAVEIVRDYVEGE